MSVLIYNIIIKSLIIQTEQHKIHLF